MSNYITTSTELTSIADAIRAKGGTSASMSYPGGFVSAIGAIPAGGVDVEDGIITRTISGTYENSRVTEIGRCAFVWCSITAVSFPACITIGNEAFSGCDQLVSANFPACETISSSAFSYCYKMKDINFPACTIIGDKAFYYCQSITTASFPLCSTINRSAFYMCNSISNIYFPVCTSIGNEAFAYCSRITTINFPVCTSVMSSAFTNCYNISIASFPACVSIGNYAFSYCYKLTSLYLIGSSVVTLSNSSAFVSTPIAGYTASTGGVYGSIYVPSSLLTQYKEATNWTYFSDRFVGV